MKEELLPIGSIVTLKDGIAKLMIIGYCKFIVADTKKENDYVACLYPVGLTTIENVLSFKKEQIDKVLFKGLDVESYKKTNDEEIK